MSLIGIGLYTPADAQRLIRVPSGKLGRWLRGHQANGKRFDALWRRQIDLGDDTLVLSFRDLIQARVASALIEEELSARKVRRAIALGADILQSDHPFATARFRTDGKTLLLQSLVPGEDDRLIDLFKGGQYVMRHVIEPSLKGVEFEDEVAARWWPLGRSAGVVVDPARVFGRPIDNETGVPTDILVRAIKAEGSIEEAARAYLVPTAAVRRSLAFEQSLAA